LAICNIVLLELCRRKDVYVLFILTALITLVVASAQFFGETGIVRIVREICLLLIWVSSLVIAVTLAARQIPAEREYRTLFPLLAKPVSRSEVMLGKFAGCWQATGITLAAFYLFFALVSGSRDGGWPWVEYFQAAMLHWFMLGVVIAMALLGSVVFAAPSSNGTILFVVVAGILLVARHLNKVALQLPEPVQSLIYTLYFLLPHLEIFDLRERIIHSWGGVAWLPWLGALLYAGVYATLFLVLACLKFRRLNVA
jgi:ABC-type transport system involved in multi-copper enzyme maturation permease subunit